MPQIVKTDIFQTVVSKNKFEVPRDVLRRQDLAQGIYADIVEILFAVRFPHRPPHLFLLCFLGEQDFLNISDQRHGAVGRFRFHHVVALDMGAALFIFDDLMADINFRLLPIDRRPF